MSRLFCRRRPGRCRLKPCRSLCLISACRLKQLRIDRKPDSDWMPKQGMAGRCDVFCELLFEPFLNEVVRDANYQFIALPLQTGLIREPKLITWFTNSTGDRVAQSNFDFAVAGRQRIPPCTDAPQSWNILQVVSGCPLSGGMPDLDFRTRRGVIVASDWSTASTKSILCSRDRHGFFTTFVSA